MSLSLRVTRIVVGDRKVKPNKFKLKYSCDGGKPEKIPLSGATLRGSSLELPARSNYVIIECNRQSSITLHIEEAASEAYELIGLHKALDEEVMIVCGGCAVHLSVTALNFGLDAHTSEYTLGTGDVAPTTPTMLQRVLVDVVVVECRCLPKMDVGINATCDAYVTLEVGSMLYKTWRVGNTLHPLFSQEDCSFVYQREHESADDSMLVTCFDYDRGTADDLVGSVSVSICELAHDHGLFGQWYQLKKGKRARGWIKLKAQINREDQPSMLSRYGSLLDEIPFRVEFGDVVLFSGQSFTSKAISAVTGSKWDHAGIVFRSSNRAQLYLLESTMAGVKLYPFDSRVRYFAKHGTSLGFRRLLCERTDEMKNQLQQFSKLVIGVPYEKKFVELAAALSQSNKEDDLSSIFCSELVVAALKAMRLVPSETLANNFLPSRLSKEEMGSILVTGVKLGPIKKLSRWTYSKNEELRKVAQDLRESKIEQAEDELIYE